MKGLLSVGMVVVLATACTSSDATPALDTSPQDTIPSGWTTYSNEIAGFSISYPSDWEVLQLDETAVEELFTQIENATGVEVQTASALQAGLPLPDGTGYRPIVSIFVEPIPDSALDLSLDAYTELWLQNAALASPSYEATKRTKAIVGGNESMIVHASYEIGELTGVAGDERFWLVQLIVLTDEVGWNTRCGTVGLESSEATEDLAVCESVVRTFVLSAP